MHKLTIGWRLTLWYGAVLAVGLFGFAGVVYSSFARNLMSEIDRALAEELSELAAVVREAPDRTGLVSSLQADFGRHEFYEIQVSSNNAVVFHTPALVERRLPVPDVPQAEQSTVSAEVSGLGSFRVATQLSAGPSGEYVIQAADSLKLFHRELAGLLTVMLSAGPIVLGVGLAGGYWLSRRALAPVDRLTTAAIDVSAARLDRRVAVENPDDELGRLALAFNGMIERLERSFDEMRRFTADAAHELRTPLAVLRSEAEVTLRSERSPSQYRHVLENQLEEIARLTRLADELLFLCREDAGLQKVELRPVRVDEVLEQLVGQLQTAAQAREVTLELEFASPCSVPSDPDRLRRLFFNLIDNALKYTPASGRVRVRCVRDANQIEVTVTDTGIGIPAEHLPHVCQRFYRVDQARDRSIEGTGLGLSICQSIVEAHHGALRVEHAAGGGTQVVVTLPLSAASATENKSGLSAESPAPAIKTNISGSKRAPGDGVWVSTQSFTSDEMPVVIPSR
jgi:two-component system, OmpR family, heavy metal sensor histidine kinase CusS